MSSRVATTTARRGSSRAVALSSSTARAGVNTLNRVSSPQLTNTLRSGLLTSGSYDSYGSSYGYGYNAGLSFGFGIGYGGYGFGLSYGYGYGYGCAWGFYGYPFYYGSYWPYYRYRYYSRPYYYGYGSYYPYYGRLWYWPSSVYAPTYYGGSYDSYGSTIVVRAETRSDVPEEEVALTAEESLARLADRFVALGDFYFREGRFSEAAEAYARARTYAPDDATIHFVLSDALFALGDYHFAAFLISEALRLEPNLARADADKTTFYADPEVFARQMDTLAKYLADKPYDAAAHLVNGYNLRFSGRPEEAKVAFRRVLEIEPGNQGARTFLDALESPDTEIEIPAPAVIRD